MIIPKAAARSPPEVAGCTVNLMEGETSEDRGGGVGSAGKVERSAKEHANEEEKSLLK